MVAADKSKTTVYDLKDASLTHNRNAHRYTTEHIELLMQSCGKKLKFFGYTQDPSGAKNPYEFFQIDEGAYPEVEFCGFRKHNEKSIKQLTDNAKASNSIDGFRDLKKYQVKINEDEHSFEWKPTGDFAEHFYH